MQSDFRGSLAEILRTRGLTQVDLAKEIGVSQSTLCRALGRGYMNQSKGRARIEAYLGKTELEMNKDSELPHEISLAIANVWDRTSRHARIISEVIQSLAELTPRIGGQGEKRQNDRP